jgi:hypothetical protein
MLDVYRCSASSAILFQYYQCALILQAESHRQDRKNVSLEAIHGARVSKVRAMLD